MKTRIVTIKIQCPEFFFISYTRGVNVLNDGLRKYISKPFAA